MRDYFWNLLISLDQFANAILAGNPDEVISSRAYRNREKWYWGYAVKAIDWVFGLFGETEHCKNSVEVNP